MLRIVLLSLVWAICATCLVRPWFWKGVKNKYLFKYGTKIGFSSLWQNDLMLELLCFMAVFFVSMLSYDILSVRQNLYGSFFMIMLCSIAQCLWDNQGKVRYTIMLTIVAISAILWIQDGIAGYNLNMQLTDTQDNGKCIFTVSSADNGKGIVVVNKDNYTEGSYLSYSYEFSVAEIRSQYPTQKLYELYITISNDNVPYGLFAVAEKNWLLGSYNVTSYVMFNLRTGEVQELTQEELPTFVTNN